MKYSRYMTTAGWPQQRIANYCGPELSVKQLTFSAFRKRTAFKYEQGLGRGVDKKAQVYNQKTVDTTISVLFIFRVQPN